ncbi:MAG: hypothetical protein ACUVSU_15580, partial [Aggregatilineaceae bacterium]
SSARPRGLLGSAMLILLLALATRILDTASRYAALPLVGDRPRPGHAGAQHGGRPRGVPHHPRQRADSVDFLLSNQLAWLGGADRSWPIIGK